MQCVAGYVETTIVENRYCSRGTLNLSQSGRQNTAQSSYPLTMTVAISSAPWHGVGRATLIEVFPTPARSDHSCTVAPTRCSGVMSVTFLSAVSPPAGVALAIPACLPWKTVSCPGYQHTRVLLGSCMNTWCAGENEGQLIARPQAGSGHYVATHSSILMADSPH